MPEASYRAKGDGSWTAQVALSGGVATAEELLKGYAAVAAVVYPSGLVLVLWSDGARILERELAQPND